MKAKPAYQPLSRISDMMSTTTPLPFYWALGNTKCHAGAASTACIMMSPKQGHNTNERRWAVC